MTANVVVVKEIAELGAAAVLEVYLRTMREADDMDDSEVAESADLVEAPMRGAELDAEYSIASAEVALVVNLPDVVIGEKKNDGRRAVDEDERAEERIEEYKALTKVGVVPAVDTKLLAPGSLIEPLITDEEALALVEATLEEVGDEEILTLVDDFLEEVEVGLTLEEVFFAEVTAGFPLMTETKELEAAWVEEDL